MIRAGPDHAAPRLRHGFAFRSKQAWIEFLEERPYGRTHIAGCDDAVAATNSWRGREDPPPKHPQGPSLFWADRELRIANCGGLEAWVLGLKSSPLFRRSAQIRLRSSPTTPNRVCKPGTLRPQTVGAARLKGIPRLRRLNTHTRFFHGRRTFFDCEEE